MAEIRKTATENKKDSDILANLIGGERFSRIKRKKRGQSPRMDNRTAKERGRIHKKKKTKKEYHF